MTDEAVHAFGESGRATRQGSGGDGMRRLLREPLLHFLVLGALLFLVNALAVPEIPKEKLIEFTPEIRKSLIQNFADAHKRAPSPQEVKRLADDWLLNEIVFREALAQGFDKGDEMIRDRINQKMRLLIFSNIKPDSPKEADLQKWLDANRDKYDFPERISFFDVGMGKSRTDAEVTLKLINAGKEPESVRLLARSFNARPVNTLSAAFSGQFVSELRNGPLHKWQVLRSGDEWHIVRLEALTPKKAVTVAQASGPLIDDWQQDNMRKKAAAAVRAMAKSYVIRGTTLP